MIEQFWLFHCGYMAVPRGMFVRRGGLEMVNLPFFGAVAIHRERGPILIDAPFGREGPSNAGEMLGTMLRKTGLTFRDAWGVVPRLEQLGVRASDVEDVLMTHLHWDHTGGMKSMGHATFHISRVEWTYALSTRGFGATRHGFAPEDFEALESRVEFMHPEAASGRDIGQATLDLFGDGSVKAVSLPGHSMGGVGYIFDLGDRQIFFAGDAAFTVDQITEAEGLGIFPRIAAWDVPETRKTLNALRRFHELNPDVTLVTSHDFELCERCLSGPQEL